ncbi:DddA-like double-stranded DNA deaminase toxin [Actinokineospora enzanensis]|uniref:DddA-like double-stranded DNA deaminase toxin n=1 Tax=Actinokineospora enzanensis TaxID=155975 RepID=UPI000380641C|nr:DddA-like double-stranded DNA deaminase toxin [Actinokineospora enzanensis]
MSTILDHAAALRAAGEAVPVDDMRTGMAAFENVVVAVLDLSTHPALVSEAREVDRKLTSVLVKLIQLRELIIAEACRQIGPMTGKATKAHPISTAAPRGRDGACYPIEAAWCAERLPDRHDAYGDRDKTYGYLHVDGWPDPGSDRHSVVVSGYGNHWAVLAEQGLIGVGIRRRNAHFLAAHVEVQVAAMMVATGRQVMRLTINHRPCPDNGPYLGCSSALPRYLPRGYTLTVYGTTPEGQPITLRVEGQA